VANLDSGAAVQYVGRTFLVTISPCPAIGT
jgi:hypothetical protein